MKAWLSARDVWFSPSRLSLSHCAESEACASGIFNFPNDFGKLVKALRFPSKRKELESSLRNKKIILCFDCLFIGGHRKQMKAMREDIKAVEQLRKTADQLAKTESHRGREHDR